MSRIINWNFGEIKEDDEEEGVTHDWIRVAKPNQANAELFRHAQTQIIFTITIQKSKLVANFVNPEKGEFLALYILKKIYKSIS